MQSGSGRALLVAATVAGLYALGMVIAGVSCVTFWSRPDNLLALAITIACVTALVSGALRGATSARAWAQLAAGVLVGLYLQPSTAIVVSVVALVSGVRNALSLTQRARAAMLLIAGAAIGLAALVGLMGLVAPLNMRC